MDDDDSVGDDDNDGGDDDIFFDLIALSHKLVTLLISILIRVNSHEICFTVNIIEK